eukprot:jgi/Botrbrau1/12884/Bobra.0299s0004.1
MHLHSGTSLDNSCDFERLWMGGLQRCSGRNRSNRFAAFRKPYVCILPACIVQTDICMYIDASHCLRGAYGNMYAYDAWACSRGSVMQRIGEFSTPPVSDPAGEDRDLNCWLRLLLYHAIL